MLEQFIGKEVTLEWILVYDEDEEELDEDDKYEYGILLYARKSNETDEYMIVSILKEDGEIKEICVGAATSYEGTKYDIKLYIKDHKNIRKKILNTPGPKTITREELIDLEE